MATAAAKSTVDTIAPPDAAAVGAAVRAAHDASRAVYPLGGSTALNYGNTPTRDGLRLDLTGLDKVVDYTPRDMTILVEAGVRMATLAETLAAEGQHLPIDVPRASEATLGGVVATNWNGPRRYGHGTVRDYVIGVHAVDGRGIPFRGGGRVVKNVAGYDFCKLLTGSLGTLGVITQLALKVKPQPETSAALFARCTDLAAAEKILARLVHLPAPPVAIDLLVGASWNLDSECRNPQSEVHQPMAALLVRLEGTEPEVASLAEQTQYELWSGGAADARRLDPQEADALWIRQVEFSDRGPGDTPDNSPLVLKIAVPPSAVTHLIAELVSFDAGCTIQAHAGNGVIIARLSRFAQADLTNVLVAKLRPAALQAGGSLVIVSTTLEGLTPHLIWGGRTDAVVLMEQIKRKLDPRNILNPGRFAYQ